MPKKTRNLTKRQQRIIARIRRLLESGEPLNITAVKRRHPKLMEQVYAVKPFWGWKRALKDAGIKYSGIRVELRPFATCKLCGEEYRNLVFHVTIRHQCSIEDYRIDFPDAELVSEEFRAACFGRNLQTGEKARRPPIPHWEPLWSPEYVLDRADEFRRRGFDMTHIGLTKVDMVVEHSSRLFGSWDEVLGKIGLDPKKVRILAASRELSAKEVLQLIGERRNSGQSLKASGVYTGTDVDVCLIKCARAHYGSWRNALRAAGLDSTPGYGRVLRFPDAESVCKEIRRRRRHGLSLRSIDIPEPGIGDKRLYVVACKIFGSWGKAVDAAGIDYSSIRQRNPNPYRTKAAVIRALRERRDRGMSLDTGDMRQGKHANVQLFEASLKLFGKWSAAKRAARVLRG